MSNEKNKKVSTLEKAEMESYLCKLLLRLSAYKGMENFVLEGFQMVNKSYLHSLHLYLLLKLFLEFRKLAFS